MRRHGYRQMFLNVAGFLLVVCVVDFRPLVIGGFFKLVTSLVLAILLMFVVIHAANLWRVLAACLQALPVSLFALVVDRRCIKRLPAARAVPNEPNLSPLFQRPPPIFSL